MKHFKLNKDVYYTVDIRGTSVINRKEHNAYFIEYPEAAVWFILNQRYPPEKSRKLIEAILLETSENHQEYIQSCIENWRTLKLIR
jgi:hypothetical protein